MSTIHSGHDAPATSPSRCAWAHHFEDVTLWCGNDPIPGDAYCGAHWGTVERCHCGQPVDKSEYRDRGMCTDCDTVRCDAYPNACWLPPL